MPEYLSPGVYIQEVDSGPRPIEGVGTACAAFVGFAPAGPANYPSLITNWSQYVETFGAADDGGLRNPHLPGAYLSHAVYGYFLNGGGRCYVTRIAPEAQNGKVDGAMKVEPLQIPSKSSKAMPSLTIGAKGTPVQDIAVEVAPPSGEAPADGTFTLRVRMGPTEEVYENVSLAKRAGKNVVDTVNQASQLVMLVEEQGTGTIVERTPDVGSYLLKAQQTALVPTLKASSFTGNVADRSGMEGLEVAEDVTMICCPDLMSAYQTNAIDRDGVKAVATVDDRALRADGGPDGDPRPAAGPLAAGGESLARARDELRLQVCRPLLSLGQGRRDRWPPDGGAAFGAYGGRLGAQRQ